MTYDDNAEREWFGQDGGMLIGRQAALSDWSFRKEQKEFGKLVANLKARNWAKANPEKRKQILAKCQARPEYKEAQKKIRRAKRLKAWLARQGQVVTVCAWRKCGKPVERKRLGRLPKFCCHNCAAGIRLPRAEGPAMTGTCRYCKHDGIEVLDVRPPRLAIHCADTGKSIGARPCVDGSCLPQEVQLGLPRPSPENSP